MQKNPGEVSSALAFIAKDRSSHPMGSDKPLVLPFLHAESKDHGAPSYFKPLVR
jgi:hypothetical protein